MAQAGTAHIEFRGDFGRVSRELRSFSVRASAQAGISAGGSFGSSFSGSLRSALSGARQQITDLARLGATALAGLSTAGAGYGLKLAADAETTRIAFEGLLGSAEAAQGFIDDLREFAKVTPFELPGLQDAARRLLGVGFAAEDVIPALSTIGDVAATLGVGTEEINGVIRALGQMKGKGKITAEELQQISEQVPGFSAVAAVAKGLGKTVPETFDLMAKGAIPADEGIAAILEGMRQFPGAAGAMERQAQTLTGMFSTFKDTIGLALTDALGPAVEAIKTVLPDLSTLVGDTFAELGPEMAAAIGGLVSAAGPLVTALAPVFRDFLVFVADFAGFIGPALEALTPAFDQLADVGFSTFSVLLDAIAPLVPVLGTALEQVGRHLGGLLIAVQPLLADLAEAFGTVITALGGTFAAVMADVADAAVVLLPALGQVAVILAGAFGQAIQAIAPLLPNLAVTLAELAVTFANGLADILPVVAEVFAALAPHIQTVARLLATGILSVVSRLAPLLPGLAEAIGEIAVIFAELLSEGLEAVAPLFPVVMQVIRRLVPIVARLADALGPVLLPVIEALAAALTPIIDVLADQLLYVIEQLTPILMTMATAFAEVARVAGPVLAQALRDVFAAVQRDPKTFQDLVTAFADLAVALLPLIPILTQILTPLIRVFAAVQTYVVRALTLAARVLSDVLGPALTFIGELVNLVVAPALNFLATVVTEQLGAMADQFQQLWEVYVRPALVALRDFLVNEVAPKLVDLRVTAEGVFKRVAEFVATMWNAVRPVLNDFVDMVTRVKNDVRDRIDQVAGFFRDLPGRIGGFFSGLADIIKQPFDTAVNAIRELWNSTLGGVGVPEINVPGVGTIGGFTIPEFHTGLAAGPVPGRRSQETLAKLTGGEWVSTPEQMAALLSRPAGDIIFQTQATDWATARRDAAFDLARMGVI